MAHPADPASLIVLEVTAPGGGTTRIESGAERVVEVGRATFDAIGVPRDPHLSARHFAITCDGEQSRLRDRGSTNGTFLNGVRVSEATLKDGDRIEAGQSVFMVKLRVSTSSPVRDE